MLGLDRRAARYTWTVVVIILLLGIIFVIRKTLFIFTLALLFAYMLWPLVHLIDQWLPMKRSRTPALAIVYILLLGILVAAGITIGTRVVEQASALANRAPELLEQLEKPAPVPLPESVQSLKQRVVGWVRSQVLEHKDELVSLLPKAGLKVLSIASSLAIFILVPILSFFFLKDARHIRKYFLETWAHGDQRLLLKDIAADLHVLLAQYIRALVVLSLATFFFYGLYLSIIGAPYSILLAAIAGPLEFIPLLGPLTASIIILVVAGVSRYPHWLAIGAFLAIYRLFQDYVLSPHLMSSGAKLHPLLVLFGVLAGGEIAGIPGTFLSVPVLAALRIVYIHIQRARLGAKAAPPPATVTPPGALTPTAP